jgi:hypothetical protein
MGGWCWGEAVGGWASSNDHGGADVREMGGAGGCEEGEADGCEGADVREMREAVDCEGVGADVRDRKGMVWGVGVRDVAKNVVYGGELG